MIVLGCDPSLTDHGWTVIDYSLPPEERLLDSGRIRTKSKEFFTRRYRKHWEGVEAVFERYSPDYVGIEIPPPQASWSAGLYPIWIKIADICTERRVPFATWMPTTIKAYARDILGDTGKMFKSDMVDAALEIQPYEGRLNHNIADSILINHLSYRLRLLILGRITENELTEKERYIFTRTVTRRKTGKVDKLGMIYKEGEMYYNLDTPDYDYLYEEN